MVPRTRHEVRVHLWLCCGYLFILVEFTGFRSVVITDMPGVA
jgi:hypothetical protein